MVQLGTTLVSISFSTFGRNVEGKEREQVKVRIIIHITDFSNINKFSFTLVSSSVLDIGRSLSRDPLVAM